MHFKKHLVFEGLTLQCRPRSNVRTFNTSHPAGLGAPYGHECI